MGMTRLEGQRHGFSGLRACQALLMSGEADRRPFCLPAVVFFSVRDRRLGRTSLKAGRAYGLQAFAAKREAELQTQHVIASDHGECP